MNQQPPLMRHVEVVVTEHELQSFAADDKLVRVMDLLRSAGIPVEIGDRHAIDPFNVTRGNLKWIHNQRDNSYTFRWTEQVSDDVEDVQVSEDIQLKGGIPAINDRRFVVVGGAHSTALAASITKTASLATTMVVAQLEERAVDLTPRTQGKRVVVHHNGYCYYYDKQHRTVEERTTEVPQMKARQHRKTVQRRMKHWVAGASWRRMLAMSKKIAQSVANSYGALAQGFADIEHISALKSVTFARFPYQDLVFDEQSDFIPLLQPRTTSYLKSLITKDYT